MAQNLTNNLHQLLVETSSQPTPQKAAECFFGGLATEIKATQGNMQSLDQVTNWLNNDYQQIIPALAGRAGQSNEQRQQT